MFTGFLRGFILILIPLGALAYVWSLNWICDDAWISFRYARHLITGQGLVFNPGEYVEGFTNLLWTLLLAAGLAAGIDPTTLVTLLSLVAGALSWWAILNLYRRLMGDDSWFPASLIALAGNYTWGCFGTSGLETPMVCALGLTGIVFLLQACDSQETAAFSSINRGVIAGTCFALAILTRPDAIVLAAGAAILLAWRFRKAASKIRVLLAFLAPSFISLVPVELWRISYYGLLLPNTFYAKTAGSGYSSQGFLYVSQFISRFWLWPFLAIVVLSAIRGQTGPRKRDTSALGLLCLLHLTYVIFVGGDFMEGRFLVVILPLFLLLVESAVRTTIPWASVQTGVLIALIGVCWFSPPTIHAGHIQQGIADERTWEPMVSAWFLEGEILRKHLPPDTLVATENIGAFGWASGFRILDLHGLTDTRIAQTPTKNRGRPGHEKMASLDYLLERKTEIIRSALVARTVPHVWKASFHRYFVLRDHDGITDRLRRAGNEYDRILDPSIPEIR